MGVYLLSRRQLARRIIGLSFSLGSGFLALNMQRQYMLSRGDIFQNEYEMIKSDTNYYHTLHEQVLLGFDEKVLDERENENGILKLRQLLASKASGIVLETNIGSHRNYAYYDFGKIKKFIGVDWVASVVAKSE